MTDLICNYHNVAMFELYILVPVIIVLAVIFLVVLSIYRKKRDKTEKKKKSKNKNKEAIIREANRKLAANPKDTDALEALGEIYYNDGEWEKTMKTYGLLQELCGSHKELDELTINIRFGLAAMKMKNYNAAYKSFLFARSMREDIFEVNYNLGYLEYLKKNFEKAAGYLSQARVLKNDHQPTLKYLGLSLSRINKHPEAAKMLKQAVDFDPGDKETLFILGQTYYNLGRNDLAQKIFSHLRGDPVMGPKAAIFAGTLNSNVKNFENAIMDYEIGLKHDNIPADVKTELHYRLAQVYLKTQQIPEALSHLKDLKVINPQYKDVDTLIQKYSEMNTNKNLQIFLLSETSEFATLCRRLASGMFPKAKVKVLNISVQKNEHADILAEISTSKWEDIVLFRFIRTTGVVGELVLRDLYSKLKEVKAGRGFCITAGTFSENAKLFVEARLIDLIEKPELTKHLEKLS